MTDALREELARIGEAAPRASVPGDVWVRGRRARRRDRVVAGAAVLSVLVVLGGLGLVLGLPGRSDVPPAGPGGDAVPSVIHPVPTRLADWVEGHDETWRATVAETDLAIGRGSVAFVSGSTSKGLPVVVTAADGQYHLLRLPAWIGTSLAGFQSDASPLALSPDGRQLAWGWYDASTRGSDMVKAGVRVVDLTTGRMRTIPLTGGRGVAVGSVRWSPDSRWLVWQGMEMKTWEKNATGWKRNVAGRIAPGSASSEAIDLSRGGSEQLVIDDRGTVSWVDEGIAGWSSVDAHGRTSSVTDVLTNERGAAAAISPSGRTFALADGQPSQYASFFQWTHLAVPGGDTVPFIGRRDLPAVDYPEGAAVEPLGWLDDDHVVALVTPAHDVERNSGWTNGEPEVAVLSAPHATPAYDVVARVERGDEQSGQVREVTVAVDLMSLDHPTRDFPAPEWPWSDERKVEVFGGAGLAVVAVLVFVVSYRRGRRLG